QTVRDFLARWGVTLQQGQVIDVGRNVGSDPKIPLLQKGQYNTENLPELVGVLDTTFYPGLGALVPSREKMDNIGLAGLAVTSSLSWLVADPTQTTPQPSDTIGPFTVAVAVKAAGPLDGQPDPGATEAATLVVFADSDFATNKYFYAFSNGDFLLNAVNWLAGDISLVSIRPKPVAFRELVLTRTERDFIRYSTWLLLPLAMLSVAGLAWWRRR
ncbi:MAG: hypothetical protein Q8O40_09190, partial [Chloroflexota bacterium]|nr:hypothetical protein [Chloroflexota bacterium]